MMLPVSTKKPESTWISEVPSHWKESKNKYVFKLRKEVVGENWKNYTLLSLSKRGVVPRDIESGKGKFPESFDTYQVVRQSDLVFCLYDVEETPRAVGISETIGMITGSYDVLEVIDGEPKFFYYYYLTVDDFKGFKPLYTGMRNVVRPENFNNLKIYLPPLPEQQQIVTYLDHKTTLIDQIISNSERKIELLKEQRTSIINHTVTKGLNPKVKMKDSGVEWIGEIPEGWEIIPLKYIAKITLGKMLTSEDKGGQFLKPYLRSQNVQSEECDLTDVKEMWFSEKELLELKVHRNDLLVNEGGDVGRTSIWSRDDFEVYIQNSVNKVSILNGNPKYYLYHFLFHHKRGYFDGVVSRVSIPHLTKEKLSNIDFISPPLQEQQQIVTHLDQKTKEIDDLISSEQRRIELMKEYRQSLISEVVTGKIKVTNE